MSGLPLRRLQGSKTLYLRGASVAQHQSYQHIYCKCIFQVGVGLPGLKLVLGFLLWRGTRSLKPRVSVSQVLSFLLNIFNVHGANCGTCQAKTLRPEVRGLPRGVDLFQAQELLLSAQVGTTHVSYSVLRRSQKMSLKMTKGKDRCPECIVNLCKGAWVYLSRWIDRQVCK